MDAGGRAHAAIVRQAFLKPSKQLRGPALAKITALLEAFGNELGDHPQRVRFMAQFDAMYARDWSAERLLALEDRLFPGRFEPLSNLIREGIADGSLRPDLDPDLTMHSVLNAVVGAQRRLASLGNRVEQEYGQPIEVLFAKPCASCCLACAPPRSLQGDPRMQRMFRQIAALLFATLSLSTAPAWGAQTTSPRQLLTADYGWKFLLGDPADAAAQSFQDSGWRTVDLPHDWSIEAGAEREECNRLGRWILSRRYRLVSQDLHALPQAGKANRSASNSMEWRPTLPCF